MCWSARLLERDSWGAQDGRYQQRYTFDEWLDSPANTPRSELVDGLPVERMPTSWDHGQVVKAWWRWLDRAEQAGYGQVALGPVGVLLDADGARRNVREPDLCFVAATRASLITAKGIEGVPDLVIEVLSPGNREQDLPGGGVYRDCERFGVPAYWIVDPDAQTVSQFALARGRSSPASPCGWATSSRTSTRPRAPRPGNGRRKAIRQRYRVAGRSAAVPCQGESATTNGAAWRWAEGSPVEEPTPAWPLR